MTRPRAITVDRAQWLGHRWTRHGLGGHVDRDALDDLLLLGFQDTRLGGAKQSLIQRTRKIGSRSVAEAIASDGPLVSLWSVRGAPHAHRLTHLDVVRDALGPHDGDEGGADHADAVDEVAAALSAVVTAPMSKAKASTEVTERVSAGLVEWCARCQAHHVPDALFRSAGRQAQIVLGQEQQRSTMLHPTPDHPQQPIEHPRRELLNAYLRVNGPTSRTQFRDWMESTTEAMATLWSELDDDIVKVRVDGRRYDLPEPLLDDVTKAAAPHGLVLVPPHDPYLRQVDRTLLVPDRARRQEIWRPLSGPGALLVDGEVAGTWRYRRGENDVTITLFDRLTPSQRRQAETSAPLVGRATGADAPTVTWER